MHSLYVFQITVDKSIEVIKIWADTNLFHWMRSTFIPNNRSTSLIICCQAIVSNDECFHFCERGLQQENISTKSRQWIGLQFYFRAKGSWIFFHLSPKWEVSVLKYKPRIHVMASTTYPCQNGITVIQCPNVTQKSNWLVVISIQKVEKSSLNESQHWMMVSSHATHSSALYKVSSYHLI